MTVADSAAGDASGANGARVLIDQCPLGVIETDPSGNCLRFNRAAEALFGARAREWLGRPFHSCVAEKSAIDHAPAFESLRVGDCSRLELEMPLDGPEGERWLEFLIYPLRVGNGQASGALVAMIRDITDARARHATLARAKTEAEQQADSLSIEAFTDPLTGAANRRAFERRLQSAIDLPSGGRPPTAVAMIDIDNLKAVNDRFGHAAGDEALRRLVAFASMHLRSTDLLARIGGDEFALMLPGATAETALEVVGRLVRSLGQAQADPPVTVSAGITALSCGQTAAEILAEADRALYAAKRTGGNQTMQAAESGSGRQSRPKS